MASPTVGAAKTAISNVNWTTVGIDGKKQNGAKKYAAEQLVQLQEGGLGEVRDLGYAVLEVGRQSTPAVGGYRALDALARMLSRVYPEETCIAVCVEPRYQTSLLISSNARQLDADAVKGKLRELLEAIRPDELKKRVETDREALRKLSASRGSFADRADRERYAQMRFDRDTLKVHTALNNMLKLLRVVIVKSEDSDVHAELQILDYIEAEVFKTGGESRQLPLYLGVSLRCCGKCQTVINAYNSCGFNHVQVLTRGSHPTYDAGGWRCPRSLVSLISETDSNFRKLSEALQYAKQPAKKEHPMSAELSDSEDEYVGSQHKL